MNFEMEEVTKWFKSNSLSVNIIKSIAVMFGMDHLLKTVAGIKITRGDPWLEIVDTYKYLCVLLENPNFHALWTMQKQNVPKDKSTVSNFRCFHCEESVPNSDPAIFLLFRYAML